MIKVKPGRAQDGALAKAITDFLEANGVKSNRSSTLDDDDDDELEENEDADGTKKKRKKTMG